MYYSRIIDRYLLEWARRKEHKPLLLRGARQTGKTTAVKHLGEQFEEYVEINFEKQPAYKSLFEKDLDVNRIIPMMSALCRKRIIPGKTLLFLDEIQNCCKKQIIFPHFRKKEIPRLSEV